MPEQEQIQGSNTDAGLQTRHKIAISFSLLLLTAATAFWLLFQNELNRSLNQYSAILGATLAEQTAASLRELVLVDDLLGLNVELSQLVRNDNILYVSVLDVDGNLLASAGQGNASNDEAALFVAPITVQEAIAGSVMVQLDLGAAEAAQARLRNIFLLVSGISLVLVITTAFAVARRMRNSTLALADSINDYLDDGEDDDFTGIDETAKLKHAIARMLGRLQDMEEQMLETGVWQGEQHDIDDLPARLAASVLVVKVVNLNTAIELLHPDTLAGLLREFHFYLNQASRLYGGECHRLSGESAMICFDADTCDERHSANALTCAGLFLALMATVNQRHRSEGGQALEFRMAIHSGDVFRVPDITLGSQGAVAGAMGKTIDITYFLSKQAAPGHLVISEPACAQARKFIQFPIAGQNEVSMPADNMVFMAYILDSGFAAGMDIVRKQCGHILGASKDS